MKSSRALVEHSLSVESLQNSGLIQRQRAITGVLTQHEARHAEDFSPALR
jgi:hypothetical protein